MPEPRAPFDRRTFFRRATLGAAAVGAFAAPGAARESKPSAAAEPDTSLGKHVLDVDFPGLAIGCATDPSGPTGCSVFWFPKGATASADVRGGAPGTRFTDQIRDSAGYVDAICLAGGSLYGLEASSGVARGLFERRGRKTDWKSIACVAGAIIYDYSARKTSVYPDLRLGRAAFEAAKPGKFPLGGRGAGASASCGKWLYKTTRWELAGQGGASFRRGPTRVAVFTVVNSLGAIVDRKGKVVRGHLDPKTGRRYAVPDLRKLDVSGRPRGNTTLTVVATNRKLEGNALRQLGREVHASMARAIVPFHTATDGDVLFAVTTGETEDRTINRYQLATIASGCAWDAVLSSFAGR